MVFWLNLWTALVTTMLLALEIGTLVRRRRTPPYQPSPADLAGINPILTGPAPDGITRWTPGEPIGQTWLEDFDRLHPRSGV